MMNDEYEGASRFQFIIQHSAFIIPKNDCRPASLKSEGAGRLRAGRHGTLTNEVTATSGKLEL
jgi:hypothetical protein